MRVMGGLQRESAAGDVVGEGVEGARVGGGAVGGVSGAAGDGMGNGDTGVVDGEGDVPLVLPVGRVLQVVPWVAVSMVVQMVTALPVVSIVRVLHRPVVRLMCAAGGVTVQVVVRLGARVFEWSARRRLTQTAHCSMDALPSEPIGRKTMTNTHTQDLLELWCHYIS